MHGGSIKIFYFDNRYAHAHTKQIEIMRIESFRILITAIFVFIAQLVFSQDNSDKLHAVLIIGHQEDLTQSAMDQMDDIGDLFEENGVITHKFYDDKAEWEEIKKLSGKCSFLVYSGHGSTLGENSVGGLCIESLVSSEKLMSEFKLKKNALVCFQSVCLGAGSTAGDDDDIGVELAKERVSSYAYPFFEIGATAYYANNFTDGVLGFLSDFLEGESLDMAYTTSLHGWSDVELTEAFERDNSKQIVISAQAGGGTATRTSWVNGVKTVTQIITPKSYDVAYVGPKTLTVNEL